MLAMTAKTNVERNSMLARTDNRCLKHQTMLLTAVLEDNSNAVLTPDSKSYNANEHHNGRATGQTHTCDRGKATAVSAAACLKFTVQGVP